MVNLQLLHLIQLHGSETNDRLSEIKKMGFKIIKAINGNDNHAPSSAVFFTTPPISLDPTCANLPPT